jgi:hypothetical protein
MRYGSGTVVRAKPGTRFYYRMAAWPAAVEQGMKEAMRRHFAGWLAAPLRAAPADGVTRSARHRRVARQT